MNSEIVARVLGAIVGAAALILAFHLRAAMADRRA